MEETIKNKKFIPKSVTSFFCPIHARSKDLIIQYWIAYEVVVENIGPYVINLLWFTTFFIHFYKVWKNYWLNKAIFFQVYMNLFTNI